MSDTLTFTPPSKPLRRSHKEIAQFLLLNPFASLSELSEYSGYTYTYCSIIINSDAFRAHLKELEERVTEEVLIPHLRERIGGAAAIALDRLSERLQTEKSVEVISDAAEILLRSLGYGSKGPSVVVNTTQQTVNVTDRETLAKGRALLARMSRGPAAGPPEDLPILLSGPED